MSILPNQDQHSISSSSSSAQFSPSSSNHGFNSSSPPPSLPPRDSPTSLRHQSGHIAPVSGYSGGFSRKVNERKRNDHGKSPIHQNGGKTLQPKSGFRDEIIFSDGQVRPAENAVQDPTTGYQCAASTESHGRAGHSTGRKAQVISGNHLLNFHYDPIPSSRPQPKYFPKRRQQKRNPYNKDLFFQANYKFVVLDSGNHATEPIDPDKMLNWEEIICLKYRTPVPAQCPICLDEPLCPQITSCGHIFCFPCILQYLYMGEDDHVGECWKRCPLCFTMIGPKDLYTVHIENVKQYNINTEINFVLLTRQKNLFTTCFKNNDGVDICDDIIDSFSKFTLTSDVECAVRKSMLDLDSWIAKADSGLVDDIEKLPYVCAAIKLLEQRKKYWNEHCSTNSSKVHSALYESPPTPNAADTEIVANEFIGKTASKVSDKSKQLKNSIQNTVARDSLEDHNIPTLDDDDNNSKLQSHGFKDTGDDDSYYFYQAADGQHLILHPFNMKCLLHHYGSYDKLPNRITGKILNLESLTQSDAMRKRYRFLSHFSLTTTFQLCEIDLTDSLQAESLSPFMDEIKNREKQRNRLSRKELKNKIKAEAICSQFSPMTHNSYDASPSFSMDDFEALGGVAVVSSSPPILGERHSFSSVAKLGFAAAHDSPALKAGEYIRPSQPTPKICVPAGTGMSFANIMCTSKAVEGPVDISRNANEVVKKGKKTSRVLLSTAGGRRY